MSFGIAKDVKSEVRVCTPELLNQTLDSPDVARICVEIEDALEKCRRGELTKEEYETVKANRKKRLPIYTFHATFKNGRRKTTMQNLADCPSTIWTTSRTHRRSGQKSRPSRCDTDET